MRRKVLLIAVLVLLMLFAVAPVMSLSASAEEDAEEAGVEAADVQPAPTATIFSEGWESGPGSWLFGDSNPASGLDYWWGSTYRKHGGSFSVWCAASSDHPYGANKYDNNMEAYVYKEVDLSGYSSVSLSFWFYCDSEIFQDRLYARYRTGTTWHDVFGGSGDFTSWVSRSYSIPNTADAVGFWFESDTATVDEGAYIDDITLTGIPHAVLITVLDFGFTPNPVSTGATCKLQGTLKTILGGAVYPANVVVDYSTDGGATWNPAWTLATNAAGAFSQSFAAPGTPGNYLVRCRYAGSASYGSSSDTETLKVTAPANPTVEIWTNKVSFAKGETLNAYVQLYNPGAARSVKVNVWFGLPGGGTYLYETYYLSLPASYTSPVYIWKSVTIPYSAASGTYSVNAEVRDAATNALLDSDTYYFTIS